MDKGFSLMEVLIATSVSVVVGVLLLVIIVNSAGVSYKQSSKFQEGTTTNDIQASIVENIKSSSAVLASYTSGGTTYTSGAVQLILKIPTIDSSNNIISNAFDYFVYFLDSGKLRFKTFPDVSSARKAQDQIFSTLVDSLTLQYFNSANPPLEVIPTSASKIRMTIRLKQKSGASFEINTATTEANLRND